MARLISKGEPAQYHQAPVVFTPFGAKPGDSFVPTSDPWSFLRSFLSKTESKSRQDNKVRLKCAHYYAILAEEFYRSAENARLPAKATLAYYGVLNLAKCFICTSGKTLGDKIDRHGLSPSDKDGKAIRITSRGKNHINIFHEFAAALGPTTPSVDELSLEECIAHIPEIQEIAYRLELLPNNCRNLLPLEIEILTDDKKQWLFSDVSYAKRQQNRLNTDKFLSNRRKDYFRDGRETNDGRIAFRCRRRKKYTWQSFERIYGNLCSEYRKLDLAALLTKDGYRYYCDIGDPKYHHLAYSFILMVHLGTTPCYSPVKTQALLDGALRPLIAEALSLTPKQFLYQLASYITGEVCVVPYANI